MESKLESANVNSTDIQNYWNKVSEICTEATKELAPKETTKAKFNNGDIVKLSKDQKDLRQQIETCQDPNRKRELKTKRNKLLLEQHKLVNKEYEKKLENDIEEIEKSKDDSHRMFKAIRVIQKKRDTEPLIIKKGDNIIGNTEEKIEEISKHFQKCFQCTEPESIPDIVPQKLKIPFTVSEVEKAVKSLKNNKSAGCDNIKSENIKYAPCTFKHITNILNHIAETGEYPEEIKSGLLTPLQKPGKEKGPPENLRPVILLSTLRKILAICVIRRIREKIDEHVLPVTQTAYSAGRSTTELVFTFKTLAEKAISSCDYEINLLLLDMSKAFDTIQRGTLIKDLQGIIDDDELHLIVLLLDKVNFSVKLEGKKGKSFLTNIGSPQGDGASALFFIIYLALSLLIFIQQSLKNKDKNQPKFLQDHNYSCDTNNNFFTVDQQYADDIGWASTGIHILENIEKEIPQILKERNLFINKAKTEKYTITRSGPDNWKKCKYVGSLLGTHEDINRRIGLANGAYNTLRNILNSKKVNRELKLRIFCALIESIFLYNSECWGLNKLLENKIDVVQRKFLRNILGIRWSKGNWINNTELYKITHQTEWSKKIAFRRLRFFGHVARLPEGAPAKIALTESTREIKKPVGRPSTSLLSVIKSQLQDIKINSFKEAISLAQNRKLWRNLITTM